MVVALTTVTLIITDLTGQIFITVNQSEGEPLGRSWVCCQMWCILNKEHHPTPACFQSRLSSKEVITSHCLVISIPEICKRQQMEVNVLFNQAPACYTDADTHGLPPAALLLLFSSRLPLLFQRDGRD